MPPSYDLSFGVQDVMAVTEGKDPGPTWSTLVPQTTLSISMEEARHLFCRGTVLLILCLVWLITDPTL